MAKKKVAAKKKASVARRAPAKAIKKKVVKKLAATRKKKVLAVPKGYHNIIPYLVLTHADKAIEFYKKAFGAKEAMRIEKPDGKIAHAELKIGDSRIMLADECHEMGARSPKSLGGSSVGIHFYTKDVDGLVKKAVSHGAKVIMPLEDMFWGDRCGMLEDPYGHQWFVAMHIEDVSLAKAKKRMAELYEKK